MEPRLVLAAGHCLAAVVAARAAERLLSLL